MQNPFKASFTASLVASFVPVFEADARDLRLHPSPAELSRDLSQLADRGKGR